VAGAVIVQAAMETLGYNLMTVSERDLLDGLVLRGA
jgi:exopolyphosphatase/pppGpp-phosphohydrolase